MGSFSDYLKLHFIIFLWGFTAILGVLISIPAVEMVFFRALLAAVGLAFIVYFKGGFKVSKEDFFKLMLTGFIIAAHWIAFFGSARLSNVSVSLVGLSTASLWTSFIEPWMHRRKIKQMEVLLGLSVIVGLYIIFSIDFQYTTGLLVGILAGFLASVFAVFNSKLVQRIHPVTITFYEMSGAALGIALFFPFYAYFWTDGVVQFYPTMMDWLYLMILSFVCTIYTFTEMTALMKKLTVFFIQLSVNLEPLYGIIMAVIFFKDKEQMSINFYVGALVILSAVIAYPALKRKFDRKVGAMH